MAASRRKFLKTAGIAGAGIAWKGLDCFSSPVEAHAVAASGSAAPPGTQIAIAGVSGMPNMPSPYNMRNWQSVAQAYDAFVFNFTASGQFLPVGTFTTPTNPTGLGTGDHAAFAQAAYVASDPITSSQGIGSLAAVVGATLSGINKLSQGGYNYVAMCQNWYLGPTNNQYVYLNTPTAQSGASFWYDLFPNILFYQLNYLYPNTSGMPHQFLAVANQCYNASVAMGGSGSTPSNYNHTAFNFTTMLPVDNGCWQEPDSAAAFAWLSYMAYVVNGASAYLKTANWGMQFLNSLTSNPFYEVLLPFGAYLSARMNAEQGTTYNTSQLLNWCFDGSSVQRPGWGVLTNNTSDLNGLVGETTDSYVFAMNSFEQAGALVPLVRYDTRFAHDIGKWVLNLANAAAFFYNGPLDAAHQSNPTWTSNYDTQGIIAYEGILDWKPGTATASSDYSTTSGSIVSGDYTSTQYRSELPNTIYEVLQEAVVGSGGSNLELVHTWVFNVPSNAPYFVVVGHASGDSAAHFAFSYSTTNLSGSWTALCTIPGSAPPPPGCGKPAPTDWTVWGQFATPVSGTVYIRVVSNRTNDGTPAQVNIDAMGICYETNVTPFGLGAPIGKLSANPGHNFPCILYRRESDVTGLGLYGSSHVGILGGIVSTTNVSGILSLDLLKTDYYHAPAYQTNLIYNPLASSQNVQVNVGSSATDIYDAVSHQWVTTNVTGTVNISVASDTAGVIVEVPHGATLSTSGNQLLANGIVIDWNVNA